MIVKYESLDDVIEADNRWKFETYGDSPPKVTEEELKIIRKEIKKIKEKNKAKLEDD